MYYKTTITAGATVEVYKYFRKRERKGQRGKKVRPTPAEMEKINQRNAERRLRLKINANFGEDDLFVTLTYRKEERPEPEEAKKQIKKFLDSLRKEYKTWGADLKYINVTEYRNKAIHHHLLINHVPDKDAAKAVRQLWPFGRPDFKYLDDTGQYKDLAAYLIKETSGTFKENKEKGSGHKQRYSCSRNLILPKEKTEIIRKAAKWTASPRAPKGYYIDQDTIYNGVDAFTGLEYQQYIMVKLKDQKGTCG